MPKRISDEVRAAILADLEKREGVSSRKLADRHGVSERFVRKVAKEAGLVDPWSRAQVEQATRARVIDMKAERARLAEELLLDAQRLRDRAWSTYQVVQNTKEGPVVVDLMAPPLGEVRHAYISIGIAVDKSRDLLGQDADLLGLSDVDAWLAALGADVDTQAVDEPLDQAD